MSNLFYRNPRLTALTVLFLLLTGAMALRDLPRQEDPTLTERFGAISTFLPGATAERVESLVTERIERKLREIPEVNTIESRSRSGYSLINVELAGSVDQQQADLAWSELRDKLGELDGELPPGTTVPLLEVRVPVASTLLVAFTWTSGEPELAILSRLAAELELELRNIGGTKETEIFGEIGEEVLVTVDPYRLAAAGLGIADLAERIHAADTRLSAGKTRGARTELLVEVKGELDSAARIARIPIARGDQGLLLRVADVAEVRKHRLDPPETMALTGGRRAVVVSAVMEPNIQISRWSAAAEAVVAELEARLPDAIALEVIYRQNQYTSARMGTLAANLLAALGIVLASVVWFMGARAALTVGIALPLSAAMVLVGLELLGIPLHQMSVTGLIIALGLLIDNAIIVVEEYRLDRRRGLPIDAAVGAAVRHLAVPLGASTATSVFAFAPIALAPGAVGEFTGTIAVSVILAISSSFVLAITVVPAIAGFVERRWPEITAHESRPVWVNGFHSERLLAWYRSSLQRVLGKPGRALAVGAVLPFFGFALAPTLTQQFFSPVDRNQFQVQLSMPSQSSLAETFAAVEKLDALLEGHPEVVATHWFLGEGAPRTFYNVRVSADGVASFAGAFVDTTSAEATRDLLPGLQAELRRALPEAQVLALPFEQGPPFDAPIEVRIVGTDLATLRALGERLRLILTGVPDVTYTRATLASAQPRLTIYPREDAAELAGFPTGALPGVLNAQLQGVTAGAVQEGETELPVRVRADDRYRSDVDDIATMPIASPSGGILPLDAIAELRLEPVVTAIERYQGERVNVVYGFLVPFTLPAVALARFQEDLAVSGFELPAGYRLELGGEQQERQESQGNLFSTLFTFLAAMVLVVVLSLSSFRAALLVALTGFLSIGLGLFGIRLLGYPFGFMALIGTVGLVGLAINGSIIVLSALAANPQARLGDLDAALEVVIDATRHIVATTATTVGGFLPLILFGGTFWPPLAAAIAGGVAGSAVIALYTTPALYLAQRRRSQAGSVHPVVVPTRPLASRVVGSGRAQ